MKNLNRREQSQVSHLKNQINDTTRTANRLQEQLDEAERELMSLKLNLGDIARDSDPLRIYQGKIIGTLQRHEILRRFIRDMAGMPSVIMAETQLYEKQIAEIEEAAAQRCATIKMLEEEHALNNDLPVEQRRLLLDLKAAQAA